MKNEQEKEGKESDGHQSRVNRACDRLFAAVVGLTGCTMYTAPCAQGGASKPYQNKQSSYDTNALSKQQRNSLIFICHYAAG